MPQKHLRSSFEQVSSHRMLATAPQRPLTTVFSNSMDYILTMTSIFFISSPICALRIKFWARMPDRVNGIANLFKSKHKKDVWWCNDCRKEVNLGSGCDGNWEIHIESSSHLSRIKPQQSSWLTAYFTSQPQWQIPPPPPKPLNLPSSKPDSNAHWASNPISLGAEDSDIELVSISSTPSDLCRYTGSPSVPDLSQPCNCLSRLQNSISMLPDTTPLADIDNPLARYVFPRPMADYKDPTFVICNHLSYFFKPDSTPAGLAQCIARGSHGLNSFLFYLHNCHLKWNFPLLHFDFVVDKLISAILLRLADIISSFLQH